MSKIINPAADAARMNRLESRFIGEPTVAEKDRVWNAWAAVCAENTSPFWEGVRAEVADAANMELNDRFHDVFNAVVETADLGQKGDGAISVFSNERYARGASDVCFDCSTPIEEEDAEEEDYDEN